MKSKLGQYLQNTLFPIHSHELPKIFPLFLLFFLISFIYNLLRPLKISLVVNAPGAGAEVTAFIKGWAVFPVAFFFAIAYTKLSKHLRQELVFYCFLAFFVCFFLFFSYTYPHRESLELHLITNFLEAVLPQGLHGLSSMIRHWDLTLLYAMSELWGNIMLTVLAWGFANECVSMGEAKRFYAIIAVGADSAGIFSGQFGQMITTNNSHQTIQYNMISISVIAVIIALLYRWLNCTSYFKDSDQSSISMQPKAVVSDKKSPSFLTSILIIMRSKYLLSITIIVIAYNMVFNLFDLLWIDQLKIHFSNQSSMNAYMHQLTSATGIVAASVAFFISGNVIRKFGWGTAALITPAIILITSIGFFSCLLWGNPSIIHSIWTVLGNPLHSAIIFFGTLQYCSTRACKYTVFDATKEMAFIPLPKTEKRQSKIIIDTLVSRGSKSASSYVFQVLLLMCSGVAFTTPYIAFIIGALLLAWFIALNTLNKALKPEVGTHLKIL